MSQMVVIATFSLILSIASMASFCYCYCQFYCYPLVVIIVGIAVAVPATVAIAIILASLLASRTLQQSMWANSVLGRHKPGLKKIEIKILIFPFSGRRFSFFFFFWGGGGGRGFLSNW